MVLIDVEGLQPAIDAEAANLAEVNLIGPLLDSAHTPNVSSN